MAFSNAVNATQPGFQSITSGGVWNGRAMTAGGGGVSILNGDGIAGNPTFTVTGGGISWVETAVNVSPMVAGTGYFCISPGVALTLLLPAAPAIGDTIHVSLDSATSWQITQPNAGSQIRLGSVFTTGGLTGSLTSTAQGDSIELVARTVNLWVAQSVIGNITVA